MINNPRLPHTHSPKLRAALYALVSVLLVASFGCRSRGEQNATQAHGIIVINAPAAGEVRRVLVSEGMAVSKDAPVIEIAVRTETPNAPPAQGEDPQARARRNIGAAQTEIDAARAEVVRTEVEVQRLTPLVSTGDAPQAQLDGARAEYDRAQQRLQRAQSAGQDAQAGLVAARQPQSQNSAPAPVKPSEQIVVARASSAGTVSAISAQVGARVTAGQPLATLRAGEER